MQYTEIKRRAREQAEEMHQDWLAAHFDGTVKTYGHQEQDPVDEAETFESQAIQESMASGAFNPEQLEHKLARLLYFKLKDKTFDEWRDPELLLEQSMTSASAVKDVKPLILISEMVESFLADKQASKSMRETSIQAYRDSIQLLTDVLGDRGVEELTYHDCTKFRDKLTQLPPNRKKREVYRDKTVADILCLKLERSLCLSSKYINDVLNHCKTYFSWLVKTKVLDTSPFEGVSIEVKTNSYGAYTSGDLNIVFSSPLFQSNSDYVKRYATKAHWWITVLAAFTGGRQSEIVQLNAGDIIEMDGVMCISMLDLDEDQNVKSKAGRRLVPLHSVLIKAGFLEYVESVKKTGHKRLFHNIKVGKRNPGQSISKWYNERYRESNFPAEFKKQKKVFHSFRHTFIQEALRKGVDLTKLQLMVGHEPVLMGSTKTYMGEAYSASILKQEMELVEYDDVSLDNLVKAVWQGIPKE